MAFGTRPALARVRVKGARTTRFGKRQSPTTRESNKVGIEAARFPVIGLRTVHTSKLYTCSRRTLQAKSRWRFFITCGTSSRAWAALQQRMQLRGSLVRIPSARRIPNAEPPRRLRKRLVAEFERVCVRLF